MFRKIFLVDCRRSFSPVKTGVTACCIAAILILSNFETVYDVLRYDSTAIYKGIVQVLGSAMSFDKFKLILVILLAGVYTNSFCLDDSSHYLRMILTRADLVYYVQSRFLVNALSIILVSIAGFVLAVLALLPLFPLIPMDWDGENCYYSALALNYPVLYIVVMGSQFGLVSAACSSIGLLFSAFQRNQFVSIGLPAFVFYLSISYIPADSVFDVLPIVSMAPSFIKDFDTAQTVNFLWSMLYPAIVITLCGYFFYRRLRWRVEHGLV